MWKWSASIATNKQVRGYLQSYRYFVPNSLQCLTKNSPDGAKGTNFIFVSFFLFSFLYPLSLLPFLLSNRTSIQIVKVCRVGECSVELGRADFSRDRARAGPFGHGPTWGGGLLKTQTFCLGLILKFRPDLARAGPLYSKKV